VTNPAVVTCVGLTTVGRFGTMSRDGHYTLYLHKREYYNNEKEIKNVGKPGKTDVDNIYYTPVLNCTINVFT